MNALFVEVENQQPVMIPEREREKEGEGEIERVGERERNPGFSHPIANCMFSVQPDYTFILCRCVWKDKH